MHKLILSILLLPRFIHRWLFGQKVTIYLNNGKAITLYTSNFEFKYSNLGDKNSVTNMKWESYAHLAHLRWINLDNIAAITITN